MKPLRLFTYLLLCMGILAACAPQTLPGIEILTDTPGIIAASQTPFMPFPPTEEPGDLPGTSLPTLSPADLPSPSRTPHPSPTPTPLPRPAYLLDTVMDYDARTLRVSQQIIYSNPAPIPLPNLVLAAPPNLIPNVFSLKNTLVNGEAPKQVELEGQRLNITLEDPLAPAESLTLDLTYTLALPPAEQGDPAIVRPAIFGYTARQVNLVDWYPMIVPYHPKSGWVLNRPWLYGEHLVYDLADFEIILRFRDPSNPPIVAASGAPDLLGDSTRYTLRGGRTFAFSMSRQYQTVSANVDGVEITSYYFAPFSLAGQGALDTTAQSFRTFSNLFGEYPHQTLAVVQGDFNDGMEYDGLYFLSNPFYNLYDGTPKQYLVIVAAHETCHQWWFGRVANDQANEPWLDESLATYCEKLYYEKNHPDLVSWWWSYRVDFYQPGGYVDTPVYDGGGFTPYTNATYRMGAHFLEDLRQRIGDEAFFAFLRDYSERMNGQIATADDFFSILAEHTQADYRDLLEDYFRP